MIRRHPRQVGALVLISLSVMSYRIPEAMAQSLPPESPSEIARLLASAGAAVELPAEGKVRRSIGKEAQKFPLPEGASSVLLLHLPDYGGPFDLTIASFRTGGGRTTQIFVPSGYYLDAAFRQVGGFSEDQLTGRGDAMIAALTVGASDVAVRYLLVYTRGDLAGQPVTIGEPGTLRDIASSVFQLGRVFPVERALEGRVEVSASAFPTPLPRISADRLLGGKPPATSVDALESLLGHQRGLEVIVTDETGATTRGRVSSVSSRQLTVVSPRSNGWFRSPLPEVQTFASETVKTIKVVDGTRNGKIIGGVAGAALGLAALEAWSDTSAFGTNPAEAVFAIAGVAWLGIGVGHVVDAHFNRSVYERSAVVTVTPLVRRSAIGISATFRF
jgi:hypothetical protein